MSTMSRLRLLHLLVLLLVFVAARDRPACGQDRELGELIDDVQRGYAEPYLQPLADALGADFNAGLFHTASVGGGLLPLIDVYAGLKVMGMFVPDADRSFDLTYQTEQVFAASDGNRYAVPVTFEIRDAPTIFGDRSPGTATAVVNETVGPGPDGQPGTDDDVVVDETAEFDVLPGLINTPVAPFVVPHLGIGTIAGTDLVIRYLPRVGYDDYGSIGLFGLGVRHSLSQYIPLFPLSLTAQVMWQKLSIEDRDDDEIFSASAWAANLAASKNLLLLTVYGGLQVERSSIDVEYTFVPPDPDLQSRTVAFGLTGANSYRLIAGVAFGLGPVVINADAAVGKRTVVSAGAGLSL